MQWKLWKFNARNVKFERNCRNIARSHDLGISMRRATRPALRGVKTIKDV